MLSARYDQVTRALRDLPDIRLNGVKTAAPPLLPTKAPRAAPHAKLVSPIIVSVAIGMFCAAFLLLQHYLRAAPSLILMLFGASLIVFVTAFALFDANALRTLRPLLAFFSKFFDRTK